jgi:hypothetical protein
VGAEGTALLLLQPGLAQAVDEALDVCGFERTGEHPEAGHRVVRLQSQELLQGRPGLVSL